MITTPQVSQVGPVSPLLPAIKQLGRRHSKTLGFFPDGAFDDYAERGQMLAALVGGTELAGYCAFRVSKGRAMIAHLCVAENHRGAGVAKQLFESLKTLAESRDLRGIGLHCRRDYPAYAMWPKLGFVPISNKPGRGADGTELTFWWHDLHAQDLFSPLEDSDDRLRVVMDCNIFRDLRDTSGPRNQEGKFLEADWLSGQIELCIAEELLIELNRMVLPTPRDALLRAAQSYRRLAHDSRRADSIYQELNVIFGNPDPSPTQESDMRHIAMSAAAAADVFLTRDEEMLGHASEIAERYGLQVMRPVTLISRLDEAEHAALYQPARFASTDIHKCRPRPDDLCLLVEKLHAPWQRETRVQFEAKLRALLCDKQTEVVAATVDDDPLFLVALCHPKDRCEISALRCSRSPLAATALRHALLQIISSAAKASSSVVAIREPILSEEVQSILHELGFRIGAEGWEKATLRFIGEAHALEATLKANSQPPPPKAATGTEVEASYWPAKILGASVETWAVAIQPGWATELFETTFANEQLLRPKRELILSRENVYYSAAIQSGMEGATGRLLWYVSKNRHQPGSQAIRACSRLLEVRRGPTKVLFNEFRRIGVFEWREILELAGGDPLKEILAIRFADTELFEQPFPGPQAKALGILNNFTSPVKVPETAFAEIYSQGLKLSVQS